MNENFTAFVDTRILINFNSEIGSSIIPSNWRAYILKSSTISGLFVEPTEAGDPDNPKIHFVPWAAIQYVELEANALAAKQQKLSESHSNEQARLAAYESQRAGRE